MTAFLIIFALPSLLLLFYLFVGFIQDTSHAKLFESSLAGRKMTIRPPYYWLINEHLGQFSP